ncbi:hypothetical protein JOD97_003129 [Duganella sp. 1411]|jgi:hypothetical protein|nr:hypothetical protein [Duganella sp. 1411]
MTTFSYCFELRAICALASQARASVATTMAVFCSVLNAVSRVFMYVPQLVLVDCKLTLMRATNK